jgi:selenocysteine lyase/cysteine desulfurase
LTNVLVAGGVEPADVADLATAFRALRAREFAILDQQGLAYLDYTGAALPALTQLRAHDTLLRAQVYGNPHSENGPSRTSTETIDRARARVLEFLDSDGDEYTVCFTANASAAIKLVAESFPFRRGSQLTLSADNHNSVNGIGEYARRAGAEVRTIGLTTALRLDDPRAILKRALGRRGRLFAFPAQSNLSGVRHPLSLVSDAQRLGYAVLLDAAAFLPTCALSLREVHPEFVALSFYKMFGLPTGVGALVVRRDVLEMLQRPWFAGGTVEWASVQHREHRLRATPEGYEDGTPNYLGIAALEPGFDLLKSIGTRSIGCHVRALTARLIAALIGSTHTNGEPMVELYGPAELDDRGGTVTFNLRDREGRLIPYDVAEARARDANIAVRGGCFCNPGAAERAFGFDRVDTRRCFREVSEGGFTVRRLSDCLGGTVAVGAVRVSVGVANNNADIDRAVDLMREVAASIPPCRREDARR